MSFGPPPSVFTQSAVSAEDQHRKRRRKMLVAVGAVLATVLCAGVWFLRPASGDAHSTSSDKPATPQAPNGIRETVEKRPASPEGSMAFRFSVDDMHPGERYEMPGMWATDKILAKGINRSLVGFKIGTDATPGDEVWSVKFDGPSAGRHIR